MSVQEMSSASGWLSMGACSLLLLCIPMCGADCIALWEPSPFFMAKLYACSPSVCVAQADVQHGHLHDQNHAL